VQFSLAQKNVFPVGLTDGNGATYNDRIWVFVKYWNNSWAANTAWKHATLVSGGSVGAFSGGTGITSDGKGAFCHTGVNQTLRWAVGTDETGIDGTQTFKVRVFAIEMVLIPTGPFWVGSGGTESGSFTDGSWSSGATIPFTITSQGALTINTGAGNLWGTSTSGDNTIGPAGATDANFPNGYQGFYIMKYELSQGQYRNFLNTLTRAQQDSRTETSLAAGTTSVTNRYVMSNTSTLSYRNGIRCDATIDTANPITFYCDLNGNGTPNESADGEWLACNYLSWADLYSYADWAGLRPMTELEFEKACRGGSPTSNVLANEYSWGTATIAGSAYTLSNAGTASEGIATNYSVTLGNCSYSGTNGSIGPLRCGIFAANASNTGRVTAGASYYGVMELSGSLWERCVTVGNTNGRAFTGSHGDGDLSTSPNTWPSASTASGSGFRGGHWLGDYSSARVSVRNVAANTGTGRTYVSGVRLARTSP